MNGTMARAAFGSAYRATRWLRQLRVASMVGWIGYGDGFEASAARFSIAYRPQLNCAYPFMT